MPYVCNNEGVPIELKTAVKNGEPVEQWDDYWTQANENKPVMKELLKQRATSHVSTSQGRADVDQAMEKAIQAIMNAGGWDTLQSIPQGRHIEAQLRKEDGELRAMMKQLVANAGVLNHGHGRTPTPAAAPNPSSNAQIEEDTTDLENTPSCGHEYKDGSTQTDALPSTAQKIVDVDATPERRTKRLRL